MHIFLSLNFLRYMFIFLWKNGKKNVCVDKACLSKSSSVVSNVRRIDIYVCIQTTSFAYKPSNILDTPYTNHLHSTTTTQQNHLALQQHQQAMCVTYVDEVKSEVGSGVAPQPVIIHFFIQTKMVCDM